ncbi:hypothetical protein PVAND_006916 [Polypedilum vanderplanki]|uniref:Coiled-coil-helix-coiled-coil-helix domain-containing protein 7 n=1 Tax=Polypedilum vanderplanki TaxID=319348 RepID=A0A9J6C6A3_POLVA|nr:hypothetical protein PVAND_006916 [Polypedilum vanderplanki]
MSKQRGKTPDNPCENEQNLSYKCLSDNDYKKDKCEVFFANYTNCMKFWTGIKVERRRKGIKPHMPPPEEREILKAEYMKTKIRE